MKEKSLNNKKKISVEVFLEDEYFHWLDGENKLSDYIGEQLDCEVIKQIRKGLKEKVNELIYGELPLHDEMACKALKEYDLMADHVKSPFNLMKKIAEKYETTPEKMKKHWDCISNPT